MRLTYRLTRLGAMAIVGILVGSLVGRGVARADLPQVEITVVESLSAQDAIAPVPPAAVTAAESLGIGDSVTVVPPAAVTAAEAVGVHDAVNVLRSPISASATVDSATRTTTTAYSWAAVKTAQPSAVSLRSGQSSAVTYTVTATRSQSGVTTNSVVAGAIHVDNQIGAPTSVVIDDYLTSAAVRIATATLTDSTGNVIAGGALALPSAGANLTYSESFAGTMASGPFENHVDLYAAPRNAGDVPLTSGTGAVNFTLQSATVGLTATIADHNLCATGLRCGSDPASLAVGSGDAPFVLQYVRTITNDGVCGTTIITNTATVTPGNNSTQSAQITQAAVTNTAESCDTTAPITTATVTPPIPDGATGWYVSSPTVTLAATDDLSGVAGTRYSLDGSTWTPFGPPITFSADGIYTIYYESIDLAGNRETTKTATVKIDRGQPSISAARLPAANANGWTRTDVTVTFTCSDAVSLISSCTAPIMRGEGAGQSAAGTAVDNAGNSKTATVAGINVDKTAPVVRYTGNAGTYSADQMINIQCQASDALSGLATANCVNIVGPAYTFALGSNAFTASAIDKADNVATATAQFTVKVGPTNLCTLTKQFVQSSARYQALPARVKADVDRLASGLCAKLDQITSGLSASQKAGIVAAYRSGVDALVALGWLDAAQAAVLKTLATAL
jgi:hypothetical protein